MDVTQALVDVFSAMKDLSKVAYSLEGDGSFQPPKAVVKANLINYAKDAGLPVQARIISKEFDENWEFIRNLAVLTAASLIPSSQRSILANPLPAR